MDDSITTRGKSFSFRQKEMSSIFAKLFFFLPLLLLLSSNCNGITDGKEKATKCTCWNSRDADQIQLRFHHAQGKFTPIDLDASYQSYVAIRNQSSLDLPILCTVTNHEDALSAEINKVTRRTRATILCALPAKAKSTMESESSTSYMSRYMYDITRGLANLIGNYDCFKSGRTVYKELGNGVRRKSTRNPTVKVYYFSQRFLDEKYFFQKTLSYCGDRISDLNISTFNMNSPATQNAGAIIQMAATLSFSTARPLQYFSELTVAVPVTSVPWQFANTVHDQNHKETQITGFWIDIFEAAVTMMPINTTYKLVPFYGSDDQLLKEVARKTFDAAVGLTVITEYRSQVVEFSYPSFEVGPVVVMKKDFELNQVFSFMSPFTDDMWLTLALMTIFTAFVIWLVEHRTGNESGGNLPARKVGAIFWFSFATLFYGGHRESPRNSLTYFVLAPWLFLILVVTSTYTASFTSMITGSETESSSLDIENLKITNAIIGCDGDSIIFLYIVEVFGFQRKNIKNIAQSSIDDYAKALSSGKIKAAFLLTPYADVFLAKYCKGFSVWNPIRNLHGSTVVFPQGSPFVEEMSVAMSRLLESGKFKQMQEEMLSSSDCSGSTIDGTIKRGIGPGPFSGLFILSGGTSALAMFITVIPLMKRRWESCIQRMLIGRGLWVWLTTLFSQTLRRNELEIQYQG